MSKGFENIEFNEEKKHLDRIEGIIDELVDEEHKKHTAIAEELKDFRAYDYDDSEKVRDMTEELNWHWKRKEEYLSYKPSPYFGHMDLWQEGEEPSAYFVGDAGVSRGSDVVVIDWRTPLGDAFYRKSERQFFVKGNTYRLLLRRAVEITDATLRFVNTEYSAETSLDGEVIDPFLLAILQEKRGNYRLTDIIRTIQENQNEIIRKPVRESFIVQGCAGSGKTMILLHRLSYIAFNHPEADFSRYRILTPGKYFNEHIDELSRKLGLDKILKSSVEEYYAELFNRLSSVDLVYKKSKAKTERKVKALTGDVKSEINLDNAMLSEIYSEAFQNYVIFEYHKVWNDVVKKIDVPAVRSVLKICGKSLPDLSTHTFSVYRSSLMSLGESRSRLQQMQTEYQNAANSIPVLDAQLESANAEKEKCEKILLEQREIISRSVKDEIKKIEEESAQTQADLTDALLLQGELTKKIRQARERQVQATQLMQELTQYEHSTPSFDYVCKINSPGIEYLRNECAYEFDLAKEAQEQLSKLAVYNFGKRARAKEEFARRENDFLKKAQQTLTAYLSSARKVLAEQDALDAELLLAKERIKNLQNGLKTFSNKLSLFKKCFELLEGGDYPVLTGFSDEFLRELTKEYRDAQVVYTQAKDTVEKLGNTRKNKEQIIAAYRQRNISQEMIDGVRDAENALQDLDYVRISAKADEWLSAVYAKYQQKCYKRPINYRHRLYFKLLLCSLYYGTSQRFENFVCIDEAQDLGVTEYKLLRQILGEQCIFNLYGDVNQLVYEYKGVWNWEDVASSVSEKVYFLNENYRNSTQITEYCNAEFEADVLAVGVDGEEVAEVSFEVAVARMSDLKKRNPGFRAAIVYKKGATGLEELVQKQIPCELLALNEVDDRKISVITAEMAKGLEFESVIVITDRMTVNEKYIAFTRPLQYLYVTNCPALSFEQDVVEADEEESTEESVEWQYVQDEIESSEVSQSVFLWGESDEALSLLSEDQLPAMPDTALHMSIADGMGYIQRFFHSDVELMQAFVRIGEHISRDDGEVLLRISKEFIGYAKADEKSRVYVARRRGGGYGIKFKHLNVSEDYDAASLQRYLKACDQCNQYAASYPIVMKFSKG